MTITGSGWQPGEIVNMVLHETGPGAEPDLPLIATADAAGRIFNDIFAPNEGDIGRRFYLTVVGVGATAQTTFTDAPNNSTFSSTANGAAVTTFGTVLPNQCSAWWGQARQGNNLDVVTGTMTLTSNPGGAEFFANDTCSGSPQTTLSLSFTAASSVQFSFRIATTGPVHD